MKTQQSNLLKKQKFATALEKVTSKKYKLEESFEKYWDNCYF